MQVGRSPPIQRLSDGSPATLQRLSNGSPTALSPPPPRSLPSPILTLPQLAQSPIFAVLLSAVAAQDIRWGLCYYPTVPQSDYSTIYGSTVLLCYNSIIRLCYCATVLLCYCATVLLVYGSAMFNYSYNSNNRPRLNRPTFLCSDATASAGGAPPAYCSDLAVREAAADVLRCV